MFTKASTTVAVRAFCPRQIFRWAQDLPIGVLIAYDLLEFMRNCIFVHKAFQ